MPSAFRVPHAPRSIQKGASLNGLLDEPAIDCLVHNLAQVHPKFDGPRFRRLVREGLEPLGLMERGNHFARALRATLPEKFSEAVALLLATLTPPHTQTSDLGMGVFFYHAHGCFIADYGLDPAHNGGEDPFDLAMEAQREITRRFTAEFSVRPFLIAQQERALARLAGWIGDPCPHVRRWCSEGTRPRLPWGKRLPALVRDPRPALPLLEALKDDPERYVRRSVANHLGDIAKDHPELVFELCERWLKGASAERRWLLRHALRHPAKKGVKEALRLRKAAA